MWQHGRNLRISARTETHRDSPCVSARTPPPRFDMYGAPWCMRISTDAASAFWHGRSPWRMRISAEAASAFRNGRCPLNLAHESQHRRSPLKSTRTKIHGHSTCLSARTQPSRIGKDSRFTSMSIMTDIRDWLMIDVYHIHYVYWLCFWRILVKKMIRSSTVNLYIVFHVV